MSKRTLAVLSTGLLFLCLSAALLTLSDSSGGLAEASVEALPRSGVSNPVTAVLLNYRGYDTLLEVGVLLLAVIGVWSLRECDVQPVDAPDRIMLLPLLRLVLPVLIRAGAYFLWRGSARPGGAFQGGAMVGGALVLAISAGRLPRALENQEMLRAGLAMGLAVFVAVAAGTAVANGEILRYPLSSAGLWILAIEAAALISIGMTLGALFSGGRPPGGTSERLDRESDHD
jgi:multisubunit Na+/H+ antiporter MnhB subunit